MRRLRALALLCVGTLRVVGPWAAVDAAAKDDKDDNGGSAKKGGRSDFSLFDGTNPANQGDSGAANPAPTGVAGAVCAGDDKLRADRPFTYYVTVTNHSSGAAGFVRVTYKDGDFVQYPIAPGGVLSFSGAAGSKGGADAALRISGVPGGATGTRLVGSASVLRTDGGKPFCASCDATTEGGIGDAGCDAIVTD